MNERYIRKIKIHWEEVPSSSYIRKISALSHLQELEFNQNVTYFVGENGSGKSTLLEAIAIACGFNPEGGSKNYAFSTYDSYSPLYKALTVVKGTRSIPWGYFLRAESFYNVATQEMDYADPAHPSKHYHDKSHGESFLELVHNNLNSPGLYILDELEAALSPQRQLTLLYEIDHLSKLGAQFIIVSHSPILLGLPNAQIYSFDEEVHEITYEETDSYLVTEMFINHRKQLLKELLDE